MTSGTKLALGSVAFVLGSASFLYWRTRIEIRALNCESDYASSAKHDLEALHSQERVHVTEHGRYTAEVPALDLEQPLWVAMGFAGAGGSLLPKRSERSRVTGDDLPANAVVNGSAGFLAAAVGNFDEDPTLHLATIDHDRQYRVLVNDCRE